MILIRLSFDVCVKYDFEQIMLRLLCENTILSRLRFGLTYDFGPLMEHRASAQQQLSSALDSVPPS